MLRNNDVSPLHYRTMSSSKSVSSQGMLLASWNLSRRIESSSGCAADQERLRVNTAVRERARVVVLAVRGYLKKAARGRQHSREACAQAV